MEIKVDAKNITESGLDQHLISQNLPTGNVEASRYLRSADMVAGRFGKNARVELGSKFFYIDAKNGRQVVKQGDLRRIHIGKRTDGTYGIDVSDDGFDVDTAYEGELLFSTKDRDDWTAYNPSNFTYSTAKKIAVANYDVSKYFQMGDRVKLTQTTDKYFFITKVDTTNSILEIEGGDNYTFANATVEAIYFSRLAKPNGFPDISSFVKSPTLGNLGTITVNSYDVALVNFYMSGNRVSSIYKYQVDCAAGTTTYLQVELPIQQSVTINGTDAAINTSPWYAAYDGEFSASTYKLAKINLVLSGSTYYLNIYPYAPSTTNKRLDAVSWVTTAGFGIMEFTVKFDYSV